MPRPALQRSRVQHQYDVLDGAEERSTPEGIEEGVTLPLETDETPEDTPILAAADDTLVAAVTTTTLAITATPLEPHTIPTMQARNKLKQRGEGGGTMRKCKTKKSKKKVIFKAFVRNVLRLLAR